LTLANGADVSISALLPDRAKVAVEVGVPSAICKQCCKRLTDAILETMTQFPKKMDQGAGLVKVSTLLTTVSTLPTSAPHCCFADDYQLWKG
jgi:hypothetical protein